MSVRKFTFFFGLIAALGLFLANSGGRAATGNQGNTGAPGDNAQNAVCGSCHAGGNFNVSLDLNVLDDTGSPVTEYLPETTYTVQVTVNAAAGQPSGYGFQLTALQAALDVNGADVATFANPSANAQISVASSTTNTADPQRQYVEQAGVGTNNVFQVQWTAPAALSGPVSFYSCGNAVNGNGGSNGDAGNCTSLQLNESTTDTRSATFFATDFAWIANPVADRQLRFATRSEQPQTTQLQLLGTDGKVLLRQALTLGTGEATHDLALPAGIAAGHYLLQLQVDGAARTRTVIVH